MLTRRALSTLTLTFLCAASALPLGCGSSDDPPPSPVSVPAPDVAGTWLGTLDVPPLPIRVVFNIERIADGTYQGTMDSPDQAVFGIPLTRVDVTGTQVVFDVRAIQARFSGELSEDGKTLTGTAEQAGETLDLLLEKQAGPLDYSRPQDPKPPYPYENAEISFKNPEAGVTLAGTLTWPSGPGPFKTAIFISGSGAQNRDEEILNHRPFLVLADALARANIATLRYDDRGFGKSTGNFMSATSADFASDVQAAIAYLRSQERFQVGSLGLIGHSEGGLIAPMVADENPDVEFMVLLAGPGVDGGEILISQTRAIAEAQGASATQLASTEKLFTAVVACIRSQSATAELEPCLRDAFSESGVSGEEQDQQVAQMSTPWLKYFVNYDPAPVLRRTRIPVLALNGSLDLQVLADLNLPAIESALSEAGNQHATVQRLAGLNHLFQHAKTGLLTEYSLIDETVAPEVLSSVADWIGQVDQ